MSGRPLLPAGGLPSSSASDALSQKRKRAAVKTACLACRRVKGKCDGNQPCQPCLKRRAECVYDTSSKEERVQDMKNRVASLEDDTTILRKLFQQMQSRPEQEAVAILQQLRRDGGPEAVLKSLEEADLLMKPLEDQLVSIPGMSLWAFARRENELYCWSMAPRSLALGKQANAPGQLVRRSSTAGLTDRQLIDDLEPSTSDLPGFEILLDDRLYRTSASEWTIVPCEDHRFSDLIQLYLLIEQPDFAFVDKDLFLDDLISGRPRFCTPLLVNAMLALACHNSKQVDDRRFPWSERNIGSHFLSEARKLWQMEEHSPSLPTIQAGMMICCCLNMDGKDKVGVHYMHQAVAMGKDLGFFQENNAHPRDSSWWNTAEGRVSAVTEWALFRLCLLISLYLQVPPTVISSPSSSIPYTDSGYQTEKPFGALQRAGGTAFYRKLQALLCELHLKIHALLCMMVAQEQASQQFRIPTEPRLLELHSDLLPWYHIMSKSLEPDATITPQQLQFHMLFCSAYLQLTHRLQRMIGEGSPLIKYIDGWHRTAGQLSGSLKTLIERYASIFSFHQASPLMFQFLTDASYICVRELDDARSRQLLRVYSHALDDMTATMFLANTVVLVLDEAVKRQSMPLLLTRDTDLSSERQRNDRLRDVADRLYSAFPCALPDLGVNHGRADGIMRSLLKMNLGSDLQSTD